MYTSKLLQNTVFNLNVYSYKYKSGGWKLCGMILNTHTSIDCQDVRTIKTTF